MCIIKVAVRGMHFVFKADSWCSQKVLCILLESDSYPCALYYKFFSYIVLLADNYAHVACAAIIVHVSNLLLLSFMQACVCWLHASSAMKPFQRWHKSYSYVRQLLVNSINNACICTWKFTFSWYSFYFSSCMGWKIYFSEWNLQYQHFMHMDIEQNARWWVNFICIPCITFSCRCCLVL